MDTEAERRMAGLRIREARKRAKLSQAGLAAKLGLPQSVVSDWERGQLQSWRDYLPALSELLMEPPSYFATALGALTQRQDVADVPVVGLVQGGSYRMAYEVPADERTTVQVALEQYQAYHVPKLRALKVVGSSVNELYPDGTYVIVIPADETDLRHGDKVVVFRRSGELVESTIKELRLEGGRIVLYPRSSDPDHKAPIYLEDEDQDSFSIAYVVVGSSRVEERAPPPIAWPRKPA